MYNYITINGKDYPNDRENGWSHELQGVTHDKDNWYFAANGALWKIPIGEDLSHYFKGKNESKGILRNDLSENPEELARVFLGETYWRDKKISKLHLGDIDFYDKYIFVAAEVDVTGFGGDRTFNLICVFDQTLALVSAQFMMRDDGKPYTNIWWLAINPNNGLLYTSDAHLTDTSYVYVYKIGDCTNKSEPLTFHSKATLWYETGTRMERRHMQGGCFDDQNYLYLTNGAWTGAGHDYSKGTKGGIAVYRPSESPQKGGVEKLYRLVHSTQSGSFAFNFSGIGEEPEGITYWDLDKDQRAPNIRGQLHAIMLDNAGVGKDDFYFKHYRRTNGTAFYGVLLRTGDIDGAGTDAKLYITLYGLRGESTECQLDAEKKHLERGRADHFVVEANKNVGVITQIKLRSDGTGKYSEYYLASAEVTEMGTNRSYVFKAEKWFSKSAGLSHTLTATPSPVSYLGSLVLDKNNPRPGDWVYVKCKHGSDIQYVPRDKVKDLWQRSPDGKSGWVNVAGRQEEPKRNLGVYSLYKDDVGCYLRALITVEGYAGTLATEPVKILQPTLDAWRSTADQHVKLSPEKPRPGDTITAKLSSLFDGMKIHYRWRWAADTSDYYQTRSTDKTYTVTKDDLGGRIDLDITAEGYDGSIISAAVQIVKK